MNVAAPESSHQSRLAALAGQVSRRTWVILGTISGLVLFAGLLLWVLVGRGLPDAASLASYQPPLPTTLVNASALPKTALSTPLIAA